MERQEPPPPQRLHQRHVRMLLKQLSKHALPALTRHHAGISYYLSPRGGGLEGGLEERHHHNKSLSSVSVRAAALCAALRACPPPPLRRKAHCYIIDRLVFRSITD